MKQVAPIVIFILAQIASVAILVLWIVFSAINPESHIWWMIQGILLMLVVIGGAVTIFVFWNKSRLLDAERVNFISSISHELMTPLASLRLYLETMQLRKLDKARREQFIERMLGDIERLSQSISMLLIAARIERGMRMFSLQSEDLSELVEDYFSKDRVEFGEAKIETEIEGGIYAELDREAFGSVLRNLAENAVRYSTPPAEILVELKRDKGKILLGVSDKGDGINRKELKKIFKLFYRSTKKPVGTGLGLYIVRKVVRAHKGKVWAQSDGLGQGSKIRILLPEAEEG